MSAENPVLEITRVFDATPSRIFRLWLDREEWQSWIGPEGIMCEVPLLEPRVGGRYRLTMHLPDGRKLPVAGRYTAIEQDRLFAFTWAMEGEPRETLVTVALRDLGGTTELTLRQEGLPTAANRDGHAQGWSSAFDKLAKHLAATTKGE
ncbi:MAG TPA: SRPBCC domain-containing protein [Aliidongia sp.]|uniref:SRPBCC family protein n=1 Tax=Aliidongia sp. TaxID=1914230 RepID=UPI002DDCFB95|nr:SRPBCC domain-containing protein [Aliidongia sp.]HEV2674648.1 SRPBCC domain-containing protein [Aliidongia sp.]